MTRWDKYLIIFIIIISMLGLYYVKVYVSDSGEKYISIQVDGDEYKKIYFGENMEGKNIEIKTEFGYNKIEIGEGKVRVVEADCPDELDVKQGWISNPGEIIVCLPNRLIIEIKSDEKRDDGVDYISY